MVTVLRTPARPNVSSTSHVYTWSYIYEEDRFAFWEGRARRNRHRIRSDRRRYRHCDHYRCSGRRQQALHQLHRDLDLAEVSDGSGSASKAPGCPGPLSSAADHDGVTMRKPDASVAARKASLPAGSRDDAAVQLVCLALVLALVVLAARIASVW